MNLLELIASLEKDFQKYANTAAGSGRLRQISGLLLLARTIQSELDKKADK